MDEADLPEIMMPHEVAAYARVDLKTVQRWARTGKLPVARVTPGKHRRYRRADVVAVLAPPPVAVPEGSLPDDVPMF